MIEELKRICDAAGFQNERYEAFIIGLEKNADIKEELLYYFEKKDFLCKTKVSDLSLVDIMIWQIDHFRAHLDRDTTLTRNNPETMVVLAAETMLRLRNDPEAICRAFESETGTDIIIK